MVTHWIIVFAQEMRNVLIVRFGMCLFSGLFVYLKPKERRKYAAYSGEREMYHHYGMDVIVCYCCVNTAVYIFPIFLINCCYFVVFRIFLCYFYLSNTNWDVICGRYFYCPLSNVSITIHDSAEFPRLYFLRNSYNCNNFGVETTKFRFRQSSKRSCRMFSWSPTEASSCLFCYCFFVVSSFIL